jgi:hypothetical protein
MKSPLIVKFFEDGKFIGSMEPNKFMKSLECDLGSNLFLSDYVMKFNSAKEFLGSKTRAEVHLNS